jgi:hypothetical protein
MMNKQQKAFLEAKAILESLEAIQNEQEMAYIISKGLKNSDGTTPHHTWCIDDDTTADTAIEEFSEMVSSSGLWKKIVDAREQLNDAEKELIKYALSISPAGIRQSLEKASSENYTIRKEIIDTVINLDVSTVHR